MGALDHLEEPIYASLVKQHRSRITLTVDYKAWTADRTADFSTALTKADWQWSPGAKPITNGTVAAIRGWGDPCHEWMRTRDDFFPEDPDIPFRFRARWIFPESDPVFTIGWVLGAVDGPYGPVDDLRVLQVGGVDGLGFEGKLLVNPPGEIINADVVSSLTNDFDGTDHKIEVEWRPASSPRYTLLLDDVQVFTSDTAPRPVFAAFGYPTFIEAIMPKDSPDDPDVAFAAPGTPDTPVDLIQVIECTVEELDGGGYESVVFPDWTSDHDYGDIDTAIEGEQFPLEGRTCAKLFMANVISWNVHRGKSSEFDTFAVTLALPKVTDPDTYVNVYEGTRWDCEPCILIDTSEGDGAGNWTAWRRQIAGRVWKAHIEYGDNGFPHLALSGPCITGAQLYSEASLAFLKADEDIPGIYLNLDFTAALEQLCDDAADLDGHEWMPSHQIYAPDITPEDLGTGGQPLVTAFNEWADRLGQARYLTYDTSGADQFGRTNIHLQTIGSGSSAYGFRGLGGSGFLFPVMGASLDIDRRQAPGQVQYHPNQLTAGTLNLSVWGQPGVAVYPAWPYPANAPGWSDSIPYTSEDISSLITSFPDKTDTPVYGGIARHRLRNETVRSQPIAFDVIGQDYIEPDDEIEIDDPNGIDYQGTVIVDAVDIEYADEKLRSHVTAFVTDPTVIMLRRR